MKREMNLMLATKQLPNGFDALSISSSGFYLCAFKNGSTPVDGRTCFLEVHGFEDGTRIVYASYRDNGTKWRNDYIDGIWKGWKLIEGEILLWAGSVQNNGESINVNYDLNMFRNLRGVIRQINACAPCVYGVNNLINLSTMFHYWDSSGTIINETSLVINSSKKLTLYSNSVQVTINYATTAALEKSPLTELYGRP